MSIPTHSRATSVAPSTAAAEPRRTSASVRAKFARPTSTLDAPLGESARQSKTAFARKSSATTATTTETRAETRVRDERLVRRSVRSPMKKEDGAGSVHRRRGGEEKLAAPAVEGERENGGGVRGAEAEDGAGEMTGPTWTPRATLLTPTNSAPLAGRMSLPAQTKHAPASLQPAPFTSLSLQQQESVLIDDLLFVLMGFEGQYITYATTYTPLQESSLLVGPTFVLAHGLDPSLRDLASSMLPPATHYAAVDAFCHVLGRQHYGTVAHALCAAVRDILKDYLVLIAQLEHQTCTNPAFTLHQMNLHLKPTAHVFAQLYSLAQQVLQENGLIGRTNDDDDDADASDGSADSISHILHPRTAKDGRSSHIGSKQPCTGGRLLRLLTTRLQHAAGDPAGSHLLTTLLRASSRPYMRMLNAWLHHGVIRDPHAEFLVREARGIKREALQSDYTDEYWEKRYTLRSEVGAIPPQLDAVKDKVLLAGKYLNVVRECGGGDGTSSNGVVFLYSSADLAHHPLVPQTFSSPLFGPNISSAYAFANRSLLTLLLSTHHLPLRLRSLKHYFLLDRADSFSHFLELAAGELRKPARAVNTAKLQSLLEIVLRQPAGLGAKAEEGLFLEDLSVGVSEVGLVGWLMRVVNVQGMEAGEGNASLLSLGTAGGAAGGVGAGTAGGVGAKDIDREKEKEKEKEKQLTGIEALTLDFAVPFPLSLIISRNTLTRYQLLFRYLLSLRHLEAQLTSAWAEHAKNGVWLSRRPRRSAPAGSGAIGGASSGGSVVARTRASDKRDRVEQWKRRAWCLRARMLCFVQQLLYYCTSEVIEPNWEAFMGRVAGCEEDEEEDGQQQQQEKVEAVEGKSLQTGGNATVPLSDGAAGAKGATPTKTAPGAAWEAGGKKIKRTVDELMQDHVDFLATCLKECMLTNSKLLRINAKVMATCGMFAAYTSSLTRYLADASPASTTSASDNTQEDDEAKLDKLFSILAQYEEHFSRHLKILLDALNYLAATETAVFLGLCARLSMAGEGSGGRVGEVGH